MFKGPTCHRQSNAMTRYSLYRPWDVRKDPLLSPYLCCIKPCIRNFFDKKRTANRTNDNKVLRLLYKLCCQWFCSLNSIYLLSAVLKLCYIISVIRLFCAFTISSPLLLANILNFTSCSEKRVMAIKWSESKHNNDNGLNKWSGSCLWEEKKLII